MKKKNDRKRQRSIRVGIAGVAIVTAVLLTVQGVSHLTKKSVDTSKGIEYIKSKESADAKTIEQKIKQAERQDFIVDGKDTRSLKERFSGVVVMGDSITEAFEEYDVLNSSSVVAKVGINFNEVDEQIEQARQLDPQVIFLNYGNNDIEADQGTFIKEYSSIIKKIQKSIPDAHIFVNAMFPVQDKALQKEPAFANIAEYNKAIESLCEKLQVGYLDSSDLVKDEYYEPDGIHFKAEFYPIWAEKMSEVATL